MNSQDWERFGDEIRRTVQDAIDTQDYARLNQKISDTVNDALNQTVQGLRSFGEGMGRNTSAGAGRYTTYGQNHSGSARTGGPVYHRPGQVQERTQMQGQKPVLYESLNGAKAGNIVLLVFGCIIGVPLALAFLSAVFAAVFFGGFSARVWITCSITGALTAVFGGMAWRGVSGLCMIRRFGTYVQALKGREYCDVKEIAAYTRRSLKQVVKDLEKMIAKGWFRQGHLDRQKSCLMVSKQAYDQYMQLEDQMRKKDELKRQEEMEEQKKMSGLSPEVQKIVAQGDAYVRKIRECNDAIPGEEISAKISRMEMLVDRIFDRVEENPDSVTDIRRLMEYYLPTTVKLLEAYEELDSQPVGGENIQTAKREIEETLDTLNSAFEKLLDDLFQDTAWDVSSDISVLHTMLAQEGLTENEISK